MKNMIGKIFAEHFEAVADEFMAEARIFIPKIRSN